MNRKMLNNQYRLLCELSLINSDGITLKKLASLLGVDIRIIYDDMAVILRRYGFSIIMQKPEFASLTEEEKIIEEDSIDMLLSSDTFGSELRSGKYDDYQFLRVVEGDSIEICLDSDEMDTLMNFMNEEGAARAFFIKNNNTLRSFDQIDMVIYLLSVIEDGDSIQFDYKGKNRRVKKTIRPVKIIHNTTEDTFYVLDHKGKSYNLDRMMTDSIRQSDIAQSISSAIDEARFEKMWGVNYSEKCTHVRLKIYDEANVIERVRNDLGSKLNELTFTYYEDEGYAIYEDDVIGEETFLSWVYGYGSSMVLLEPRKLVDKIINSIDERKNMYE